MFSFNAFVFGLYLLLVFIGNRLLTNAAKRLISPAQFDPAMPLPGPLRWSIFLVSLAIPPLLVKIMIISRNIS